MAASLLPPLNTTSMELAIEAAMAIPDALGQAADSITSTKIRTPPASYLPYLIYEYGLGELTPFVPNLYSLIREGIQWQRVRGTPKALDIGLSWLKYAASLEEASPERIFWNSYQLRFTRLPEFDTPDLERIEGIADLSAPRRSKFRRGVFQYDVGAVSLDFSRLDGSMLDFESGIKATQGTIVFPEAATWSFGRTHEIDHVLTKAEGTAIGNWIEPVENGVAPWKEMSFPWIDYVASWAATPEEQRRSNLAGWFSEHVLYLVLRDAFNAIIGYRRCRAVRPVQLAVAGDYSFSGARYSAAVGGTSVYIEAMTQFNDVVDTEARSCSLLVGAVTAPNVPVGKTWLRPGSLIGGHEIALTLRTIPLRKTVRDQFKILLRF